MPILLLCWLQEKKSAEELEKLRQQLAELQAARDQLEQQLKAKEDELRWVMQAWRGCRAGGCAGVVLLQSCSLRGMKQATAYLVSVDAVACL